MLGLIRPSRFFPFVSTPSIRPSHVREFFCKPLLQLLKPHHLKIRKFHQLVYPTHSSVITALKSCKSIQSLKKFHASLTVLYGRQPIVDIASKLISLYIHFNDLDSSVSVLEARKEPNTYLWNIVLKAYVNSGLAESASCVYKLMRDKGVSCDVYTFSILSKLVVLLEDGGGDLAEMFHGMAIRMGFESDVYFSNTMIGAYVTNVCYGNAFKLFGEMPCKDLVSWTSMISGYASIGNADGAFRLFSDMRKEFDPNEVTIIVMLKICSCLVEGKQLHGLAIKCGSLTDRSLKNSILKMYADFGGVDDSESLFEETDEGDVVSWNIIINLYLSVQNTTTMLRYFNVMRSEVEPSTETLTSLVQCGNFFHATQLHCLIFKSGLSDDMLMTSLLDLYARSGDLVTSTKLFTELYYRNQNSWGAMISGLIENGSFEPAIRLFQEMVARGVRPRIEHINSLVIACMQMGSLRMGKSAHAYSIRSSFLNFNLSVRSLETSILNMYVRCGSISYARTCFNRIPEKDVVTWSSMIEGFGTHGLSFEAFEMFHQMKSKGTEPNSITFLSLLSACTHSGLLHEACNALHSMRWEYSIEPNLDHYTCVVDLLGRSGKLREALLVILKLLSLPDGKIWAVLLSAARLHDDHKTAEYAGQRLLELESNNAGYYTLFSNARASIEKWDAVEQVRSVMKEMNLTKYPGWSCVEVKGIISGFVSGDRSHHRTDEIYNAINRLSSHML